MATSFRSLQNQKTGATALAGRDTAPASKPLPQEVVQPWEALLGSMIEREVLPRLLAASWEGDQLRPKVESGLPDQADVTHFVDLIIADDLEAVRAMADRVIVQGGGRDALLNHLLTPAAHLLGEMWDQDVCDFMTVTLGVYRLDQIMKETATIGLENTVMAAHDRRILLVPTPGEQHSFGLAMVADAFREGGWCVRSGPSVTRPKLLRLVRDEWFDVVGLSVTSERALRGLPSCIRAIRLASCNPQLYVMVGGNAIVNHAERTRFLGADATAETAQAALVEANIFVETTVTARLHQSKTRLVDIG